MTNADSKLIQRRQQVKTPNQPIDLVSIRRAHYLTGIPVRTIQNWAREGRITAQRDGPKLWLVSITDIQQVAATLKPGKPPQCPTPTPGQNASSSGPKDPPPTSA